MTLLDASSNSSTHSDQGKDSDALSAHSDQSTSDPGGQLGQQQPQHGQQGQQQDQQQRQTGKRRPRRSYNCGPCKKQKIKCDTQIPCGACRRHNRVDQCLAAPPNPPSPDHRKRVRKQSLSTFGAEYPSSLSNFRAEQQLLQLHQSQPQAQAQATTSTGPGYGPDLLAQHKIDNVVKLPSLHTYTTTFKVSDKFPHSYTSSTPAAVLPPSSTSPPSLTNKPWELPSETQRSNFHLTPPSTTQTVPTSQDLELIQLKSQVATLTDRLSQLEAKLVSSKSPGKDDSSLVKSYNDGLRALPDMKLLEDMVVFYKAYVNKPLEVLDDKTIDTRFAALKLRKENEVPTVEDWENLSLIAIIASLAVLHYPRNKCSADLNVAPENVVPTANTLLQVSKKSLKMVKYKETPKLLHLQILLMYDFSLGMFNKKNLIMAMGSELVSIAYVLGLQSLKIPQNALEVDAAQKVWWTICHHDTQNSIKFGVPALIRLEALPKDNAGSSQILKAFISAELNTSYQSLMTHVAKLTKIVNEIPPSMGASLVEYFENLIMVDRQLTAYQVPQSMSILNPRNDVPMNFQCCYLHLFVVLNRFRIYRKIYFAQPDDGIWFIMLSIVETFLKKYNELRELYPPSEYTNHYHQLGECIITGTIADMLMVATEPEKLPRGLRDILSQYSSSILTDINLFRGTIFNENVPFYQRAFEVIDRLTTHLRQQSSSSQSSTSQDTLTFELQKTKVFDSHDSSIGLVPSNDFFNVYFGNVAHHRRNVIVTTRSWRTEGVLDQEQVEFLTCLGV